MNQGTTRVQRPIVPESSGAGQKKLPPFLNQNAPGAFQWFDGHAQVKTNTPGMTRTAARPREFSNERSNHRTMPMNASTEVLDWRPTVTERAPSVPEVFRVGRSLIHRRTGRVESPKGEHRLRAKELELILHLYENVTLTFSRGKLLQLVWNCQPSLITRTVDQTVATLRKKIEVDPDQPRFLQTVYGIGYRLVL